MIIEGVRILTASDDFTGYGFGNSTVLECRSGKTAHPPCELDAIC